MIAMFIGLRARIMAIFVMGGGNGQALVDRIHSKCRNPHRERKSSLKTSASKNRGWTTLVCNTHYIWPRLKA